MKTFPTIIALCLCLPLAGAEKDKPLPKDLKLLKALAEKGDAEAQFQLADKFCTGEGVKIDLAESFKWASRSAAQDNPKAQYLLASLYRKGFRIPKDENKEKTLFKESKGGLMKLAKQGDADAQEMLGDMYAEGEGVEKDAKEAVKWYRKAAEQGDADAQLNLGSMYYIGDGVPRDYVTAYAWYNIAAANGNALGKTWKDNTARLLTPAQITKGKALTKKMLKKNPKLLKK